jgi:hypothetical protein
MLRGGDDEKHLDPLEKAAKQSERATNFAFIQNMTDQIVLLLSQFDETDPVPKIQRDKDVTVIARLDNLVSINIQKMNKILKDISRRDKQ